MIKSSIEKISEGIGFDIAHSDDQVQANLINGLSRGLSNSMQKHDREMQLCYIVDKLTPDSCNIIKELAEFVKLKENK
jgi:hypothetical protein